MYNPNKPNQKNKTKRIRKKTQQQQKIAKPKGYINDYTGEQYSK